MYPNLVLVRQVFLSLFFSDWGHPVHVNGVYLVNVPDIPLANVDRSSRCQ